MVKRLKIALSFAASSLIVLLVFQNCAKYGVAVTETSLSSTSSQSANSVLGGSIIINNGAQYTNTPGVVLQLTAQESDQMYISNTANCSADGKWEALTKNKLWVLSTLNSEATVYAKFKNSTTGVETDCVQASIIHDNIAPVIQIDALPKLTNNAAIALHYTTTDNLSGVQSVDCKSDSGWSAGCPNQANILPALEGNHHVVIQAVDKAGNISQPVAVDLTVDLTAPTIEFNQTPASITANTESVFSFIAKDILSGIKGYECQVSSGGVWKSCSSPFTGTFIEGVNQFSVRAFDNAGNVSDVITYKWMIDLKTPSVTLTKTPSSITNSNSASFEFNGVNGAEAITLFKCSLDGAVFSSCSSPVALSALADGTHKFQVIGYNNAGTASQPASYSWLIDSVKPTVTLTSTPANPTNSANATFTFTTSNPLSGIKEVQCDLDNAGYKACVSGVTFSSLTEGTHIVHVRPLSNAGNLGDASIYTWRIDLTPPKVTITSAPNAVTSSNSATLVFTAEDNSGQIAKIECQLDGAGFSTCASPMNYTNLAQDSHVFQVRAVDSAGLVSSIASANWLVDSSGPTISFTTIPSGVIYAPGSATISYQITDAGVGIATVMCGMANALVSCANSATKTLDSLAAGLYTYTVQATDSAGNKSEQSITFTISAQPCVLSAQTVPVKVLFVVDISGSNAKSGSYAGTDPNKAFRTGEIQTFFDAYKAKTNFSWGFITFSGSSGKNLIGSTTTTAQFSNATDMAAAITKFKASTDSGGTPYGAALDMSAKGINVDPIKSSQTKYIVVFISDGAPSDVSDQTVLNSYVTNVINQAPGQATLSTVFYGQPDPIASNRLSSMASTGLGKYIDMNQYPQGTIINIEDVINVPGAGCTAH